MSKDPEGHAPAPRFVVVLWVLLLLALVAYVVFGLLKSSWR